MKKQLIFIVFLLVGSAVCAQKSSVKIQIGYGIPLAGTVVGSNTKQNGTGSTSSNITGSLGSGLSLETGYSYSFTPLISTQVDFNYLMSKEYSSKNDYSNNYYSEGSTSAKFYQVAPLVRFDLGDGKIHPYAAIGPVFSFGTMKDHYFEEYDGSIEEDTKYSGSVAVGGKTVLGLEFTQGKFGYFVQATMINMSYAPTKSEITKYVYNGQDQLSQMTKYGRYTEYKNSVEQGSIDPGKPRQALKNYYPLSSFALSVGARFKF